jgi:hypothetical protein
MSENDYTKLLIGCDILKHANAKNLQIRSVLPWLQLLMNFDPTLAVPAQIM